MSLLFDQNLSRRLVGMLAAEYPGSEHVEGAGLLGADDLTVWQYAAGRGMAFRGMPASWLFAVFCLCSRPRC